MTDPRVHVQESGSVASEPRRRDLRWDEPEAVRAARRTIREWELRNGHDSYVEPLGSGYKGYQAKCWDCEWTGPEYLRGDEPIGTPESRVHKANARRDAAEHRRETKP